eukprot:COSAG01_NODE_4377_length_5085_cov_6.039110_2_plen_208_part_00
MFRGCSPGRGWRAGRLSRFPLCGVIFVLDDLEYVCFGNARRPALAVPTVVECDGSSASSGRRRITCPFGAQRPAHHPRPHTAAQYRVSQAGAAAAAAAVPCGGGGAPQRKGGMSWGKESEAARPHHLSLAGVVGGHGPGFVGRCGPKRPRGDDLTSGGWACWSAEPGQLSRRPFRSPSTTPRRSAVETPRTPTNRQRVSSSPLLAGM